MGARQMRRSVAMIKHKMRSARFLAVVFAGWGGLSAGTLAAQQPVRELSHGIAANTFQKEFDARINNRFAPIDFSSHYGLRGRITIAIIWEKRETGQVRMLSGQSRDAMEKTVAKLADQGFRLEHMTAAGVGGPEQYTGIWSKAPGQQLAVRYGYPEKELLALHKQLSEKKHVIHRIMAIEDRDAIRFTAVWEKNEPAVRELQLGLTEAVFQRAVATRQKKGFRLRQAFGYIDRRVAKVACLWEKLDGPQQEVRIRLTDAALKTANDELVKKGFVPAMIQGFAVNGHNRYIAVWEKRSAKD